MDLLLVLRRQQAYSKNQPVYGSETWHTDRVLKPHVQCHVNITPVTFAAPRGGVKCNRGRQIRRFSTYTSHRISETVRDRAIPLFISRRSILAFH